MTAVYILLGIAALFCLILFAPVTFNFYYRGQPRLTVRVWGIPLHLLPQKEKKQKKKKPKKREKEQEKKTSSFLKSLSDSFREDGLGATLHWLGRLAELLKTAAGRMLRAVTVRHLHLELRVPGEDAAATAVHYGQVCAVAYPALTLLYAGMRIKDHTVRIGPDFAGEGGAVLIAVRGHVAVWRLLGAGIGFLCGFLRMYIKDKQKERTDTDGRKQ